MIHQSDLCVSENTDWAPREPILSWFSKDNATANRTARAQENNRLGVGREHRRVARKSDLAKSNGTCGMWKHMLSKFVCSLVLWGISRLFFALLKSDWEHKHAWLMNLVRWLNHIARSILNFAFNFDKLSKEFCWMSSWSPLERLVWGFAFGKLHVLVKMQCCTNLYFLYSLILY